MRILYLFLFLLSSFELLAQDVATENLVLHLNFDGNSLLDLSGNNHTVINHQTSFVEGCVNEGLELEGINNFLEVSHNSLLEISDEVSISMWYKHDDQQGGSFYSLVEQSADEFGGHSRYGTWIFNLNSVMACVEPDVCPNGNTLCQRCITSNTSLEAGQWYHVVSTYNGGSQKIYINGQLDSEETYVDETGISVRPFPLTIGTDMYDPNPIYLKGLMDEIRLFDIALTSEEVNILFQQKTSTSTNELISKEALTIFPNPAKHYFEYESPFDIDAIRLHDMTGRKVKEFTSPTSNRIHFGNLEEGLYIVILQAKDQAFTRKLYLTPDQ